LIVHFEIVFVRSIDDNNLKVAYHCMQTVSEEREPVDKVDSDSGSESEEEKEDFDIFMQRDL
jgi:hypothetical protein